MLIMANIAFEQGIVGENVHHAISNIRDEQGDLAAGDILRRTCTWAGEEACKGQCVLRLVQEKRVETESAAQELAVKAAVERTCSDLNLETVFEKLDLEPEKVLMIGVTGDGVGFADSLDQYEGLARNPSGWRELKGFNAFFGREGEADAIGRRLADCADINFEFKDRDGNIVFGFEHGTRPNMFGSGEYCFDGPNDTKISYTEYVMRQAIEHYGADPSSMHIVLGAAIQAHNFTKHFGDREKMEAHLPGWYDDGFVKNATNPDWRPGDPVVETDTWEADTRGMIVRDIEAAMAKLGVPETNFSTTGIIDPGDSRGVHSSHQYRDQYGDSRDLYVTYTT
jgi:hypothetical protein